MHMLTSSLYDCFRDVAQYTAILRSALLQDKLTQMVAVKIRDAPTLLAWYKGASK